MELYNHDVSFQKIIRHIWALAYVPLDQVIPVWETIIQDQVRMGGLQWKEDVGLQLASFFKYVDTTWTGELNPPVPRSGRTRPTAMTCGTSSRLSWTVTT
jgi:hypothetical protein